MSFDEKSSYYDVGGIETIEVIKAKLTPEQFQGYLLGNIIKYSCRANFKNPDSGLCDVRDVEKIIHYSQKLRETVVTKPPEPIIVPLEPTPTKLKEKLWTMYLQPTR